MRVHFEDWTNPVLVDRLDEKGLPHSDKIIKAFASNTDPSKALSRPKLAVVEASAEVFTKADAFKYDGRGTYRGDTVNWFIDRFMVDEHSKRVFRALFRFANQSGVCQAAMQAEANRDWAYATPYDIINGMGKTERDPSMAFDIHLDVYIPEALKALRQTFDYENPETMLDNSVGIPWREQQLDIG